MDHWVKEYRLVRRWPLTLSDLELQVEVQKGYEGDKDIPCDSKFIIGVMDELGNATRITHCSIREVDEEIIYMVMDNAGGHGKNESLLQYSEYLEENYNVLFRQ